MSDKRTIHLLNIEKIAKWTDLNQFYKIEQQIGRGSYGIVYKAIDLKENKMKALKINFKKNTDINESYNEVFILRNISHPNIIKLEKVFENKMRLCLVLEYCARELNTILLERQQLSERETHCIMKYLCEAVAFMHSNGIVHRDLKIENILLTDNPTDPDDKWFIKIIDLELSTFHKNVFKFRNYKDEQMEIVQPSYSDFCGTIQYIAPELYAHAFSEKCDIWSIGVIMYLLLVGKYPFAINIKNIDVAKNLIINSMVNYDIIKSSDEAKSLIKKCLNINPINRLTAAEILIDKWIMGNIECEDTTNVINIISLMNQYNEQNKLSEASKTTQENISNSSKNNCIFQNGKQLKF